MNVHDLKPVKGSNRKKRRVGRGIAGKGGKTAGRGTKGQGARNTIPRGFEGGQLPLAQRIPKLRGFNNPFRVEYEAVNLDTIDLAESTQVDPDVLRSKGLVPKRGMIKVLGRGQLSRTVHVRAHAFSKSASEAITSAGGTVETIPPPFGNGRPPAKGNQHTNR